MSLIEIFQSFNQNIFLYGGTFILVLSILVFIHEWGHYIVARMCGVRVEAFSIGFGKELFGWNDKNGTRWKISLVPLGGYVQLFGDADPASSKSTDKVSTEKTAAKAKPSAKAKKAADEKEVRVRPMTKAEREVAFFAKPLWQRAAVVFAGPAINYIFAVLLMTVLFSVYGQPITKPYAAAVVIGSNAEKYGFQPQDRVVSIDGRAVDNFEDIRRAVLISLDEEKSFVIDRDGREINIKARAEKIESQDRFGFTNSRGMLGLISANYGFDVRNIREINGRQYGETEADFQRATRDLNRLMGKIFDIGAVSGADGEITRYRVFPQRENNQSLTDKDAAGFGKLYIGAPDAETVVRYNPIKAFSGAVNETISVTTGTLEALWQIVTGTRSAKELGGVIRIGAIAGDMAKQGIVAMAMFMALLSINLGLINLFPVPMLDGGHLVFYGLEAARGKPVPEHIQERAFQVGFVFLIGLMVFTNLNDLVQLIF